MDVNVADLIPEEQVDSSHGAPDLIRAPGANNAPIDDGLTRLQSLAPSLAPKQVDVSNVNPSDLVPEEQHIPEEASRKLAEYREDPARHPLTPGELFDLNVAAQHGQGWHERAVQGVSNMFSHLKDAAHGLGQQITTAIDHTRQSRDQMLDKLGSDISLSDKGKAVAGFLGGIYRDNAVGAAKGVFGLAPLAVDLTGVAVQSMPIWPVISHFNPSIEQNTDAFINSIGDVAHAGVNDLSNKVNAATGADPKSIPYSIAENVAPLAVGAGPLEDASQAATKLATRAPRIIDSGKAVLAKGASKAAPGIGAAIGAVPGIATAAMLPHGIGHVVPELIGAFLFAGTRPGRAIKNAVTSVIQSTADEVAASATVASQAPEGVTGLEAIAQNTVKEAETSLQRAKALKGKLSPDEQAMLDEKVAGTEEPLFPDGHDALSKAQQKVRAEETKANDLGDKANIMSDRVWFAQYKEDLTRYLAGLGLHSAEGAAIGGGLGGVSAPTGDKESAASGALLGGALGAAGSGLKLPTDIRNSIRAANNFDLVRRAVQLDPDHPLYADNRKALNELTPEAKRYVMSYAGLAKPGGKQLIVLDPGTLLKTVNVEQAAKGKAPISAAPNGYVGDNIYVDKDALNSGVVPHEVTHATGIISYPKVVAAANEMMASTDPDVVAKRDAALARYEGAMQKIDPTFKLDPATMQEEAIAALGAEIMREIPPSALYGGRSTAQALSNWFANKFGGKEVKTTDQFGFPVTPEMRSAVQDALFDLGKKAAGQEPESLVRPHPETVAPDKTTPVVTSPVIDGAAQALNAVGYNKNEAQKAAEFATSQLQSETGKIPTEEEVVRRALANKNRSSAVAASAAGGTAAQGNTATITPIQELVRPTASAMPDESGQGNLSAVSKEPTPEQITQVHRDIELGKISGPEDMPRFMPNDHEVAAEGIENKDDADMVRGAVADYAKRRELWEQAGKELGFLNQDWQRVLKYLGDNNLWNDLENPKRITALERLDKARAALDQAQRDRENGWNPVNGVYIRFGSPPEGGVSQRYYNGVLGPKEDGLSVYNVTRHDGRWGIIDPAGDGTTLEGIIGDANRKILLVTGKETNIGGDGEPTLRNVRILKELSPKDILPAEHDAAEWDERSQNWSPKYMPNELGNSPSSSRDKLVGPAIQLPDGMIIRKPTHDAALKAADAAGLDADKAKLGFVTRSGKFLEQGRYTDDALNWGQEIGQIPENVTSLTDHSFNNGLGNVRRFMPRQDDLGFYSKLEQTIEDKMPNKASADQIRGIITNAGVKPEEVAWSGFDDFLKENPNVTKQQALDYLRENNVQVKEIVKGGIGNINEADLADRIKNGVRMRSGMHGFDGTEAAREILDSSDPSSIIVIESALSNHGIPNKAARQIAEDIQKQLSLGETKFHQYQLPGADEGSYRELNLFVPSAQDWQGFPETHKYSGGAEDLKRIAHVRFNDRTGPNGERILHLEEVQSDRHQKGRKEGYVKDTTGWTASAIGKPNAGFNHWEIKDGDGNYVTEIVGGDEQSAIQVAAKGIPDAPFKTTWPNLALKRMIRYAAENGYDAISWTNGEQQAARYDLSKQVRSISWADFKDGNKNLVIDPFNGNAIELRVMKDGTVTGHGGNSGSQFEGKDIADVVGKDIAEKITSEPYGGLSGDGLKVGGEGMKGFYDRILPSVANDLGKKFGARVGTIELPISERKPRYSATQDGVLDSETGRIVEHADEGADQGEVEDMAAQWNRDNSHATEDEPAHNAKVWSLPITDAMRKSVMETGQPRFMPDEIGSTPRGANEETRDLSGISAPKLAPATESDRAGAIDADNLDWVRRYFELDDKELTGKLSPHERTEMNRLYDKALQQYGSYNEFYRQNERYQPEDPNAPRQFMPDEDTQKQAERLGLSYQDDMQHKGAVLHTFNDPITKSTIAVRSDSPAGTLQQRLDATRAAFLNHDALKFMPDEDPRALKEAALRFPDGQVFTGAMHATALNDAMEQLYKDDPKGWASKSGNFESGYVTNNGEFLTRQEALQRGKELKQISKEYDRQRAKDKAYDPSADLGGLESLAFNKTRQFMPEDEKNLVALHNLSTQNLIRADKLGALALPSIAITRSDKHPFTNFGDITLVGSPDLIKPSREMMVGNSDAYSVRYPSIKYFLDDASQKKLRDIVGEAIEKVPNADKSFNRWSTGAEIDDRGIIEGLKHDAGAQLAYLVDTGQEIPELTGNQSSDHYEVRKIVDYNPEEAAKYEQWLEQLPLQAKEKIFRGFTDAGNRRYLDHNLDNVVRVMKSEFREGESFNYGAGSVRSRALKRFKSIKDIQDSRDQIVSSEQMDALKEETNNELTSLADELMPLRKDNVEGFRRYDAFSSDLQDLATGGSKAMQYLREQYGDSWNETIPKMREFLDKLRDMPTEYFEAKAKRAVGLQEFTGAVVPDDLSKTARDILQKRGLQIAEYKRGNPESRRQAVEQLARENKVAFMPEELMSATSQHADTIADHVSSISGEKWSPQEIKAAVALYAKAKQDGEDLSKMPDFAKLIEDAIGNTASAER